MFPSQTYLSFVSPHLKTPRVTRPAGRLVSPQVDYGSGEEGEEGEEDEVEGEDEEDVVADEAEEKASGTQEESHQSQHAATNRKSKRPQCQEEIQDQDDMRVKAVLQSNTAMEGYRYDFEHELWCEVSVPRFPEAHPRSSLRAVIN